MYGSVEYTDTVSYRVEQVEVAYRLGSIEVNHYASNISAKRMYRGGWIIVSTSSGRNVLDTLAGVVVRQRVGGGRGLAEAELYKGRYSIGVVGLNEAIDKLIDGVEYVRSIVEASGCGLEIVAVYGVYKRSIEHDEGLAEEEKGVTDTVITVECGVPATIHFAEPGLGFPDQRLLRLMLLDLVGASRAMSRARILNPLYAGKMSVVLRMDAAAAFLHEVGHLLEADRTRLAVGERIASHMVTVVDDPFVRVSPAQTLFDDEAVEARRKTLIEEGVVVSLLHTRETAKVYGGEPGNARGLFRRPTPSHTTLVLKPGDWRDNEIVEETRRGILVDSVSMAYTDGTIISMVPDRAWLIERGEPRPLRISRVRIRVDQGLYTIDAVSRTPWLRVTVEKDHYVAEYAPTIRLTAYVD